MNSNIMNSYNMKYDLEVKSVLWSFFVNFFKPSDPITTLTYVLKNNCFPSLKLSLI